MIIYLCNLSIIFRNRSSCFSAHTTMRHLTKLQRVNKLSCIINPHNGKKTSCFRFNMCYSFDNYLKFPRKNLVLCGILYKILATSCPSFFSGFIIEWASSQTRADISVYIKSDSLKIWINSSKSTLSSPFVSAILIIRSMSDSVWSMFSLRSTRLIPWASIYPFFSTSNSWKTLFKRRSRLVSRRIRFESRWKLSKDTMVLGRWFKPANKRENVVKTAINNKLLKFIFCMDETMEWKFARSLKNFEQKQ